MKSIILVGKPNYGKSLLFNQLTGMRQKVANFPGVTVELKSGKFDEYQLICFPGTYS
jgi:ferrous iron transport protein B